MSEPISDVDLLALVQACLDQNMSYGQTCREVRNELNCNLRRAIWMTDKGLELVHKATPRGDAFALLQVRKPDWYKKS